MRITEEQTIWFPGIYAGRTDSEYTKLIADVSTTELIELVQKRAHEDGWWAIDNGFVGDNEDSMRKMMEFVSDEKNIRQCLDHILKSGAEEERTVDWVCRDLANASKWAHGTSSN